MSKIETKENPFEKTEKPDDSKPPHAVVPVENTGPQKELPLAERVESAIERKKLDDWTSIIDALDNQAKTMKKSRELPCCLAISNGWTGLGSTLIVLFSGGLIGILGYLYSKNPDDMILYVTGMGLAVLLAAIAGHALAAGNKLTHRITHYDDEKMILAVRAARAQFDLAKGLQDNISKMKTELQAFETNNEVLQKNVEKFTEELQVLGPLGQKIINTCTMVEEGHEKLAEHISETKNIQAGSKDIQEKLAISEQRNESLSKELNALLERSSQLVEALSQSHDYETFEEIESIYDRFEKEIPHILTALETYSDETMNMAGQFITQIKNALLRSDSPQPKDWKQIREARKRQSTRLFSSIQEIRNTAAKLST